MASSGSWGNESSSLPTDQSKLEIKEGTALCATGLLQQLLCVKGRLKLLFWGTLLLEGLLLLQLGRLYIFNNSEDVLGLKQQQLSMSASRVAARQCPESFAELLEDRAIDNQIVLTVTTSLFLTMTLNLLCSWKNIGLTNYVVGALDDGAYVTLKEKGFAVFPAYKHSLLGGGELKSGTRRKKDFHKANLAKEETISWALGNGYEVLLSDADLVWTHNPLRYLLENSQEFDFQFQSNRGGPPEPHELNGGFLYVKPTKESKTVMSLLISRLSEDFNNDDQFTFRCLLCFESKRTSNTTCHDPETGAKTLMLSKYNYQTAGTILEAKDGDREAILKQPDLFTVHYSGGDYRKKIGRMKTLGQWYVDKQQNCII